MDGCRTMQHFLARILARALTDVVILARVGSEIEEATSAGARELARWVATVLDDLEVRVRQVGPHGACPRRELQWPDEEFKGRRNDALRRRWSGEGCGPGACLVIRRNTWARACTTVPWTVCAGPSGSAAEPSSRCVRGFVTLTPLRSGHMSKESGPGSPNDSPRGSLAFCPASAANVAYLRRGNTKRDGRVAIGMRIQAPEFQRTSPRGR